MGWDMTAEDDFDGVQYDDFHAPSAGHLEAEEIRRECAPDRFARAERAWLYGDSPAGLRMQAAEELAAEFGTDISEWTV